MSLRMMSFSQVIEQERRRWMPFRQALSKVDQEAFDRVFACAKQQLQAEVQLGRLWGVRGGSRGRVAGAREEGGGNGEKMLRTSWRAESNITEIVNRVVGGVF